jgi:hypothetical protein
LENGQDGKDGGYLWRGAGERGGGRGRDHEWGISPPTRDLSLIPGRSAFPCRRDEFDAIVVVIAILEFPKRQKGRWKLGKPSFCGHPSCGLVRITAGRWTAAARLTIGDPWTS